MMTRLTDTCQCACRTYDGKVFLMYAGINTALLKLEQMYELLLLE
jgi:hypothetical protein